MNWSGVFNLLKFDRIAKKKMRLTDEYRKTLLMMTQTTRLISEAVTDVISLA